MDSGDRSAPLCLPHQRHSIAPMGKDKSRLCSPVDCVPAHRLRSNQDDNNDNDSCNMSSTTDNRKTMQRSTSSFDARHEAATSSTNATLSRSKSLLVLRRCEDLNIRTGGFQKIEETAHRRRPRQQQQIAARNLWQKISSQSSQLPKEAGLRD